MARLLRTTTKSVLRPPVVTGASTQFRPLKVVLAEQQRPVQFDTRRLAHSKLRPPTVIAASIQFRPLRLKLVATPSQAYVARWKLRPPAAVSASIVFSPIERTLVRTPRQPFASHSKLRPPAAVSASIVFRPVRFQLAEQQRPTQPDTRRQSHSKLRAPIVVGASIVFRPILRKLAWQFPRPATESHWKLSPPAATGAVVVAALAAPIRVTLAAFRSATDEIRRESKSKLSPPASVASSIVFAPVRRYLTWQFTRPATASHPKLRPPAVVAASIVFAPVRVALASTAGDKIRHAAKSRLYPPVVVAASIVFAPIRRVLAWQYPRPATQSKWKLNPPAATGAVVAPFMAAAVKVNLAAQRTISERPLARPKLRAPAVVASAIVFAPIRRYLAWQFPRPAASAHSKLRPPAVTGAVVIAALANPIRLSLVAVKAAVDLIRRQPKSKLKSPAAVSASIVFPPIESRLAPSGRQARGPHSRLRPPAAVSASIVFRPIQRTLAWQTPTPARVTRSKLRPPVVVGQFFARPVKTSLVGVRSAAEFIRRRLRPPLVKLGIVGPPLPPPTESAFGLVFLSDLPLYEVGLDTVALYETSLSEDVVYTVAIQDEVSFGILGSGLTVYSVDIDDFPAS